ncbi:uncharacterized protein CEXT_556091 [Caerostris extrusa]|uniref:Cuticle protein 10.9-like n=1 Tax=Caerostris extrusa TaxID=172846 RepID=A0AAV4RNZ3_CAEEX|nr:uncharacterized protein CEXT_556091 [Caerostris extrusa]
MRPSNCKCATSSSIIKPEWHQTGTLIFLAAITRIPQLKFEAVFIVFSALLAVGVAQIAERAIPLPYSFTYSAPTEDGGNSARQESGDGSGRVSGSYTVNNLEGHSRVVEYIADENGFRAAVRSNEPGTANINPADVSMESSADSSAPVFNNDVLRQPSARPVEPERGQAVRYVLVPSADPRAVGYY